jgi:hypothetical protein
MSTSRIHGLVTRLTAADPATCDRGGLAELVTASQQVRSWLDAFDATVVARAAQLADEGRCEPPADLLAGRRSRRDGQASARRGEVCELFPGLHEALAAGNVSAAHADAVARVAADLDDAGRAQLRDVEGAVVAAAEPSTVQEFSHKMGELGRALSGDGGLSRHECRRRQRCVKRWVDRETGLCHTHLMLDPETDEKVARAFGAAVAAEHAAMSRDDDRSFDEVRADALVGLITGARRVSRRTPQVVMLVDHDTYQAGLHERTVCETGAGQAVPPETVRRVACDADIVPVVVDSNGVVLDVGRAQRTATPEQRTALRVLYRSCAHPGCVVGFDACDIHHVTPWHPVGLTDLDNLLPLCSVHHHQVHEGGWTLTLHPDRSIELRRSDGTLYHEGSTVDVAPNGVVAEVSAALADALDQILTRNRHGPPAA